jgi:hypothetical protein
MKADAPPLDVHQGRDALGVVTLVVARGPADRWLCRSTGPV